MFPIQRNVPVLCHSRTCLWARRLIIYINASNRKITAQDLTSFNGARIGVNKGSVQEGFLKDWARKNKLNIEVVPLSVEESESTGMLTRGEIDGYATIYSFGSEEKIIPVFRVGGDEFAAILEGEDYENQENLLERFEKQILVNMDRDRTVAAFGCSRFQPLQDKSMREVFERADASMYKEKMRLKSLGREAAFENEDTNGRPGS